MSTDTPRLDELLDGSEPGEHPELRDLVTRVARALLIDTSQLERLIGARSARG